MWDLKLIIGNTLFKKNNTELSIKAKLFRMKKSQLRSFEELIKPQTGENSEKRHTSFLFLHNFMLLLPLFVAYPS